MIKGQRHCVAATGEDCSAVANIRSHQPQRATTVIAAPARAAASAANTAAATNTAYYTITLGMTTHADLLC